MNDIPKIVSIANAYGIKRKAALEIIEILW